MGMKVLRYYKSTEFNRTPWRTYLPKTKKCWAILSSKCTVQTSSSWISILSVLDHSIPCQTQTTTTYPIHTISSYEVKKYYREHNGSTILYYSLNVRKHGIYLLIPWTFIFLAFKMEHCHMAVVVLVLSVLLCFIWI